MLKKSLYTAWLGMGASAAWGFARQSFLSVPGPALVGCAANRQTPAREPLELVLEQGPGERRWLAVGRERFAAGKADLARAATGQAQQR